MSTWTFKGWYKKNGAKLNSSRRDRYETDPAYKQQVLEANRASRQRKRAERQQERLAERNAKKKKVGEPWKEVEMKVNGKLTKFLTIGALASVLGRSKLGVRLLEKQGVIPTTPYRNHQKERLYSPEFILEIRKTLAAKNRLVARKTPGIPESVLCQVKLSDGSIVECPLFRIGVLAKALGCSTVTLEQMGRRNVFPSTSLLLSANRRVFTADQIAVVKSAIDRRNGDLRTESNKNTLRDEILSEWAKLKLVGATVVGTPSVASKPKQPPESSKPASEGEVMTLGEAKALLASFEGKRGRRPAKFYAARELVEA